LQAGGHRFDSGTLHPKSPARGALRLLHSELGGNGGAICAHRGLGTISRAKGDHARARGWYEESLALATRTSDIQRVSYALKGLGELERELGNLEEAAALFERSASLAREAGDQMILTYMLHGAGDVALAAQDRSRAADLYRESVSLSHELVLWRPVVHCVAGLAAVAAGEGDATRAGQLWGAREALERELGWRIFPHERAHYDRVISACVDAAPLVFQSAAARGRQMKPIEVVEYALLAD
jgi:tetratricopeptide (TPR) repeat protein